MLFAVRYRQMMMMMMLSWLFLCSLTQSEKCTEPFRRDGIMLNNTSLPVKMHSIDKQNSSTRSHDNVGRDNEGFACGGAEILSVAFY